MEFQLYNLINATSEIFYETIKNDRLVVVDFWAPWCGPCLRFAPIFANTASKYQDIKFLKINTDEELTLATELNISSIPTLMVYKNGENLFREAGALSTNSFEDLIKRFR